MESTNNQSFNQNQTQNQSNTDSNVAGGVDTGTNNDGNNTTNTGTGNTGNTGDTNNSEQKVSMTQAELDALIAKRTSRAVKKALQDSKKSTGDSTGGSTTTQNQNQNNNGKTEGNQGTTQNNVDLTKYEALIKSANKRLVNSVAIVEATKLGIDPTYIELAVSAAKLDDVIVNDDGSVDTEDISDALSEVFKKFPALKSTQGNGTNQTRQNIRVGAGNTGVNQTQNNGWAQQNSSSAGSVQVAKPWQTR